MADYNEAIKNLQTIQGMPLTIRLAIEALEKQIPKKLDTAKDERNEVWMNDDIFICPSCGGFIGWITECKEEPYQLPYCSGCGQAILWEE